MSFRPRFLPLVFITFVVLIIGCEPGNTSRDRDKKTEGPTTATPATELSLADQVAAVQRGDSTRISVSNSLVTDAHVARLATLDALTHLVLNKTEITDAALPPLAALPNLELLRISSPHVTDGGLGSISRCTSLRFLILQGASITDTGLLHLKDMNQLESLYLFKTKVTEAGVAALAEHRPGLHIHW